MSKLADFRVDAGTVAGRKIAKTKGEDRLVPVYEGSVLAFDQGLAKSGVVYMRADEGRFVVVQTWHPKTEPGETANMLDSLRRSTRVFERARDIIADCQPRGVAWEMPWVGRGKLAKSQNREAKYLSAQAVCLAAHIEGVKESETWMVNSQKVKRLLTGNAGAEKKAVRAAVQSYVPGLALGQVKPLNEDVYDAIAIGIVVLAGRA